jgi:hypothetical protein
MNLSNVQRAAPELLRVSENKRKEKKTIAAG